MIPFVEKHFRAQTGKDNRAIAGLSMGGMHTTSATNNNPGTFGWIGVFSAGGQDTPEFNAALAKIKAAGVKHYWIGSGTTDMALKGSETLQGHGPEGRPADVLAHGARRALLVHLAAVPERVRADSVPLAPELAGLSTFALEMQRGAAAPRCTPSQRALLDAVGWLKHDTPRAEVARESTLTLTSGTLPAGPTVVIHEGWIRASRARRP